MCDKDLESADNLRQWDRAIVLPFLNRLDVVDVNHKVLLLSLVMNLRLGCVSTRHGVGREL